MTTFRRAAAQSARVRSGFFSPISIDRTARVPIHRQLYDWYRAAIADGRLRPGQRVPSTRSLAAELEVSRAPVLAAFEQLIAEGYFEASIGAGTRVCDTIPDALVRVAAETASRRDQHGSRRVSHVAAGIGQGDAPWLALGGAFRVSLPALDHFPAGLWASLLGRHSRKTSGAMMAYGDSMGHWPLREAIADYLGAARGLRCRASQIMIVSGSQHGLQIAARVLLDAGDQIWVEEPGYPGAHAAFAAIGARMIPIPVDQDGMNIDAALQRQPDARLAYVTPSHQYPLGTGMSAGRRMQLLRWAEAHDAWIIEDDYDSEYRFGARPIPALQGLDPSGRVLYLGSFSKVMFPALRIGYIVIPEDLVPPFRAVREASDIFAPTLTQAALADFICEGHFSRHLRRMRTLYRHRRTLLVEAVRTRLGDQLRIVGIEAGMHLTGLLAAGRDDLAIARQASAAGVSALPLSSCCLGTPLSGLVLGYGGADKDQIDRGAELLARILAMTELR